MFHNLDDLLVIFLFISMFLSISWPFAGSDTDSAEGSCGFNDLLDSPEYNLFTMPT